MTQRQSTRSCSWMFPAAIDDGARVLSQAGYDIWVNWLVQAGATSTSNGNPIVKVACGQKLLSRLVISCFDAVPVLVCWLDCGCVPILDSLNRTTHHQVHSCSSIILSAHIWRTWWNKKLLLVVVPGARIKVLLGAWALADILGLVGLGTLKDSIVLDCCVRDVETGSLWWNICQWLHIGWAVSCISVLLLKLMIILSWLQIPSDLPNVAQASLEPHLQIPPLVVDGWVRLAVLKTCFLWASCGHELCIVLLVYLIYLLVLFVLDLHDLWHKILCPVSLVCFYGCLRW